MCRLIQIQFGLVSVFLFYYYIYVGLISTILLSDPSSTETHHLSIRLQPPHNHEAFRNKVRSLFDLKSLNFFLESSKFGSFLSFWFDPETISCNSLNSSLLVNDLVCQNYIFLCSCNYLFDSISFASSTIPHHINCQFYTFYTTPYKASSSKAKA